MGLQGVAIFGGKLKLDNRQGEFMEGNPLLVLLFGFHSFYVGWASG